jgi:hypothetical protein
LPVFQYGLGAGMDVEFFVNAFEMDADGFIGEFQLRPDFLGRIAFG